MIEKANINNAAQPFTYLLLSILLWTIVDFGTAGGFRLSYLESYMPGLLFIYIGFPLLFTFLIYQLHFTEKGLIIPTILSILIIEVLMTKNPLIITFPSCLYGIPLAIAVYGAIIYIPLWIERGEVKSHMMITVILSFIVMSIMLLTTFVTAK